MQHSGNIRQRHRELFDFLAGLAGAALVAAGVWCAIFYSSRPTPNPFEGRKLECVLDFGQYKIEGNLLYAGLSYEMLEDFATENECSVNIRAFTKKEKSLDSLRNGAADIVVLPRFDSVLHANHVDSVIKSRPISRELCWVMRREERAEMRRVNSWIEEYTERDEFAEMLERFRFMPSSYRPDKAFAERQQLSPYDDTIRAWADSIGWDWRMLAAVIYTESKFAINVTSRAGARGLMQIMPLTARVYNVQDVLNPEENIRAGASYLGRLDRLFRKYASGDERLRYVLASYNAGETRVLRYLNGTPEDEISDSALNADIDSAAVEGLREEIDSAAIAGGSRTHIGSSTAASEGGIGGSPQTAGPESSGSKISNSVTAYVDKIFENYRNFCRICAK